MTTCNLIASKDGRGAILLQHSSAQGPVKPTPSGNLGDQGGSNPQGGLVASATREPPTPALSSTPPTRYVSPIQVYPRIIQNSHPQLSYLTATPEAQPTARLIILHGYGDHAGRHAHVMQWLAARGIAAYAPDFRGHGRSAGKPGFIRRWDEYLDDLAKFLTIDELAPAGPPLFLLGHSHGGLIAVAAALKGMLNHFAGVILVAPYLALKMQVPLHKRLLAAVASHLHPSLPISSGMNASMLTRDPQMIEDQKNDPYRHGTATPRWFTQTRKAQQQVQLAGHQFNLPLLLLLPGEDTIADANATIHFFQQCQSTDKTILHFPGNRHELLRELDREQAFEKILKWIEERVVRLTNELNRERDDAASI